MQLRSISVFAGLVLIASVASAQDYERAGAYAGLNGVASFESFDGVPSSALDTGIGVAGRLGYRFSPLLAVEGQVEYTGDFADGGVDLTATLLTINGKVYVLHDQLQPYLLAGMGGAFANADAPGISSFDENSFVVKFGGGVDFYLTENIGLLFEAAYNIGTGDLDDFNYTGLGWGLFYRF